MGQVFRARDETLRREVALKFLLPRPGFEVQALAEARAVARLDQENIVRIFDVAEWKGFPEELGVPFLVMECLEGESLSALLKRGRLEVKRALEVLEGMCAGLAHAHVKCATRETWSCAGWQPEHAPGAWRGPGVGGAYSTEEAGNDRGGKGQEICTSGSMSGVEETGRG